MPVEPASFEPQPIRRASAADQIARQIRTAIREGRLSPGERLPGEVELAADFGVSRATVREAMRILSAGHLVAATRGAAGGTFVALPGQEAVAESLGETIEMWFRAGHTSAAEVDEARNWIERICVRLAARRRTDSELTAIERAVHDSADPTIDTDAFLACDLDFHMAISRAAHNAILELAMTAIHLARPRTNALLLSALERRPIVDQHRAILAAIRQQDADAAERAFAAHYDHLMAVQREALANRDAREIEIGSLTEERPARDVLQHRLEATPGPDSAD